jgi:hypothetical protein
MPSTISYFWKSPNISKGYRTGVSLHSHTNHSIEHLSFIGRLSDRFSPLKWLLEAQSRRADSYGIRMNLGGGYWTPPLNPRAAYDLERSQIEDMLALEGIVSLTDHDSFEAARKLRIVEEYRNIPISFEWTAPYKDGAFHIGAHNLPEHCASEILTAIADYKAAPRPERLRELLAALNDHDEVLVVLNHPLWNLYQHEASRFRNLLDDLLGQYSAFIHAFEVNGLRTWKENQSVAELAYRWNQLVVSGGDRHGCEPNANVNITNAQSFSEFAHEVRVRRVSHVLFMPQYADPLGSRWLRLFLDATRYYPDMPRGAQNWDDRTYHPDASGAACPLSSLWSHPPKFLQQIFLMTEMFETSRVHRWLQTTRRKELALRLDLEDGDAYL